MPALRDHRRLLTRTVAVTAAGAVALAPLQPLAQEGAGAVDPVAIRVGRTAEFTRVEFAGVIGARARVRREGQAVIVRIGATAAPDVSRLRVEPPPGVAKVETRAVQGGTELVLTLAEGADARSGAADGAVWLNLYEAAAPATESEAAPTKPAEAAIVPVKSAVSDGAVSLTFGWTEPVGAAVFRRGEAVWVVFDAPARMTLPAALGPAKEARVATGDDHVAVRIAAPAGLAVSAAPDGPAWTVVIGGAPKGGGGVDLDRDPDGEPRLVARMAGATKAVWLTDPLVGDRFAAVTARAPGKGLTQSRATVDLTLIPTAHGLAVQTPTDDLAIRPDGDLVTFSRPRGLILSPPSAALDAASAGPAAPRKAELPALILGEWAEAGHAGFSARYRELQDAAAQETIKAGDDPRAPVEARLALARFLVGSGLSYEAIGVLNAMVKAAPRLSGEPEVRGLRGAARAAIGRLDEATADFASGALAGDPSARVWQGFIAAEQGDWEEARRAFAAGASAVDAFPAEWRARFGAAHALAALESGDLGSAEQLIAYSLSQKAPPTEELAVRLIQARLFEASGDKNRALAVYKAVSRAALQALVVPARLGALRLELETGAVKPADAAKELEGLKWRWRGDATELQVVRTLGRLYMDQGLYREALTALKSAGPRMARLPGASDLQADLQTAFRSLFLEGGADGLQPVQALGLFYDFRELTPIGADGDEMVRRLSRRLVDVDLLDQAAELLKYQVDNRLEGVAKASVATDLAAIYLMDRQPEPALKAIWESRTTLLPTAMQSERRALEARALMELGRYDHALEVLASDASPAAREVRAEVFWKQQNWAEAARLYEARLGDRFKDSAPLRPEEEGLLVRAGVGYSLARDPASVSRLNRAYAPFVAGARNPAALRIALDGLDGMEGPVSATDFAGLTASADTFAGWIASAKQTLRQKTGGNGPAAPARPAS